MTIAVKKLLDSFDGLSTEEKQLAAVELLRRGALIAPDGLPDDALIAAADELFQELDAREAADADAQSR